MPFLWVFNPALLLDGTGQEIALVTATAVVAGMLIGRMSMVMAGGVLNVLAGFGLLAAAIRHKYPELDPRQISERWLLNTQPRSDSKPVNPIGV